MGAKQAWLLMIPQEVMEVTAAAIEAAIEHHLMWFLIFVSIRDILWLNYLGTFVNPSRSFTHFFPAFAAPHAQNLSMSLAPLPHSHPRPPTPPSPPIHLSPASLTL